MPNNNKETLSPVEKWLKKTNKEADDKAKELSKIFECEVTPCVFVVEGLKDAAVGFIKTPDAKQTMKILRACGQDWESGLELSAKAQLIRETDLTVKKVKGSASDIRFMDENGNYDRKHSEVNAALLFRMQSFVRPFSDQFKKK